MALWGVGSDLCAETRCCCDCGQLQGSPGLRGRFAQET